MSIDGLRPFVRRLARTAAIHAENWMLRDEPSPEQLRVELPEVIAVYTQSAGVLAADWYNDQETDSSYFATPAEGIADERLENLASWVHRGPQSPGARMRLAANTLVFDAARNTIFANAQNEGVAVVRYEYADSCHGCVARATTVPTASDSRSDAVERLFHPSCEGMLVPVRTGVWEPPGHARVWDSRVRAARRAGNTNADDIAKWLAAN